MVRGGTGKERWQGRELERKGVKGRNWKGKAVREETGKKNW